MTANMTKGNWSWSLGVWLVMCVYAAPLLVTWNFWSPLDSLPYVLCLAAGAAASVGLWRLSKPASDARRAQLRIGVICWLPCLALAAGLGANMLLDASPPITHQARFINYDVANKGPAHVRLSSWRDPRAEERLTCTTGRRQQLCPHLRRGTPVDVTTRRGALGWEWVELVQPRPR
jgi:hypothetical protein